VPGNGQTDCSSSCSMAAVSPRNVATSAAGTAMLLLLLQHMLLYRLCTAFTDQGTDSPDDSNKTFPCTASFFLLSTLNRPCRSWLELTTYSSKKLWSRMLPDGSNSVSIPLPHVLIGLQASVCRANTRGLGCRLFCRGCCWLQCPADTAGAAR
jgi:hypothetical protein